MTLKTLWSTPGIRILLLCAVVSTCVTVGIFLYSLDKRNDHLAGRIIQVTNETITIADPRGNQSTVYYSSSTKTRGLGPINTLTPGTLIMVHGERTSSTSLNAIGIRRVEDRLRIRP